MQIDRSAAFHNPLHMYSQYFGLKQEPFSIAPDPRYLFMSRRHREALAHLLYGLNGGGGFVLLSGEIGAGKTTVCRCFLEQIPSNCNVAYIFNPKLTVDELLKSICDEFGIALNSPISATPTVKDYTDALNAFLLKTHAAGQNNVLIIDEAQMLSADVLEQLRLLTNLETSERKLLQIILIGQPELRTLLARPDLEQLAQRVIARFHLKALSEVETTQYIQHRLSVSGMTRSLPFDRDAIQRIHQLSRGIPRRINLLCDRAMLGAYARGTHRIGKEIIAKAAAEVFGRVEPLRKKRPKSRYPVWLPALGLALVTIAALYVGYVLIFDRGGRPSTAALAASVPASAASAAAAAAPAASAASTAASTVAATAPASAASASGSTASKPVSTAPAAASAARAAGPASAASARAAASTAAARSSSPATSGASGPVAARPPPAASRPSSTPPNRP